MFLLEFIEPGEEAEERNKFIILVTLWTANLCAKIQKNFLHFFTLYVSIKLVIKGRCLLWKKIIKKLRLFLVMEKT